MTAKTIKQIASQALNREREKSTPLRGLPVGKVTENGGDNEAGLIEGFSVITRGEALGHRMWVDRFFVGQVNDAFLSSSHGSKVRFTHPGLSSDGLGTFLGRAKNARLSENGDRVIADLHVSTTAHETPDGNLAAYVMDLSQEDPEALGTSIVFMHDSDAEDAFEEEHSREENVEGRRRNVFRSPDEQNTNNFFHARLKSLRAVDVVDSPAANPNGMFNRQKEVLAEADGLIGFALGLEGAKRPNESCFDVDPDRLAAYLTRFLDSHGLSITPTKGEQMANEKKPVDAGIEKEASLETETDEHGSAFESSGGKDASTDLNVAPTERELEVARSADIASLCKQAGCPEKAADYIATGLSSEVIRKRLFESICSERAFDKVPSAHDATTTEVGEETEEDKWGAEWEADMTFYTREKITKEQFIKNRAANYTVNA